MSQADLSLEHVLSRLDEHLVDAGFKGFDPFDALNSRLIRALTFGNRFLGIAAVQFFKRSPVNLRRLFGVRPGINPKGWGLLLSAYVARYRRTGDEADLAKARRLAAWLIANPAPGASGPCWGYNFDWPNRDSWVPAGTPTVVNTAYIGEALLDFADVTGDAASRTCALATARFVLRDLNRIPDGDAFCFSYTPVDRRPIHNANMLGAALLARIHAASGDADVADAAHAAMRYSLNRQRPDGSWWYGEGPRNHWIDSYHTGYNLLALQAYRRVFPDAGHAEALRRGFRFYLDHFFTPEGNVKYFHDRTWPWDAHAAAHAYLALGELGALAPDEAAALQTRVRARILDTLWDERRGCFLYQVHRRYRNRIDYCRWVQCWMFYALVKGQAPETNTV